MESKKVTNKLTKEVNKVTKKIEKVSIKSTSTPTKGKKEASKISKTYIAENKISLNTEKEIKIEESIEKNTSPSFPIIERVEQNDDKLLPIASVIVTIHSGNTYDIIFQEIPPKVPESRISLYYANLNKIEWVLKYLKAEYTTASCYDPLEEEFKNTMDQLMKEINQVDKLSVLFNWESCVGYIKNHFPNKKANFDLIKYLLDQGHMVAFTDSSVKALITDWDRLLFGSNPFVHLGNCSDLIVINYNPEVLKACPSAQLQLLGSISSEGEATFDTIAATTVLGVNKKQIDNGVYELKVLSVATTEDFKFKDKDKDYLSKIRTHKGSVNHAMLTYKSQGGVMMINTGYWKKLCHLPGDEQHWETVANAMGGDYLDQFNIIENKNVFDGDKMEDLRQLAVKYINQTPPCKINRYK